MRAREHIKASVSSPNVTVQLHAGHIVSAPTLADQKAANQLRRAQSWIGKACQTLAPMGQGTPKRPELVEDLYGVEWRVHRIREKLASDGTND